MAGLVAAIRAGEVPADQRILFLHTGGQVGLFAYPELFHQQTL